MTTEWQQYGTIIYVGEGRMPQDVVGRIGNPDSCARAVACVNACAGIPTERLLHCVDPQDPWRLTDVKDDE